MLPIVAANGPYDRPPPEPDRCDSLDHKTHRARMDVWHDALCDYQVRTVDELRRLLTGELAAERSADPVPEWMREQERRLMAREAAMRGGRGE